MNYSNLQVTQENGIYVVTIHRPKVLNALNGAVIDELTHLVDGFSLQSLRGVVLRGAGEKSFVAGADISAMVEMDAAQAMDLASRGHALADKLAHLPVPVIAAVHGYALGGGCELALACDFIYASEHAVFGQPEVKLGVIPGFGGTQRLLRRVGLAQALELCMTGRVVNAEEALRIGLVNRIVPAAELFAEAMKTTQTIAANGPLAVAKVKQILHKGADLALRDANRCEVEAFSALFESHDQSEGMAAFLNKRQANFTGE